MSTTSRSDEGTAPSVTKIAKQSTAWASATPIWTKTLWTASDYRQRYCGAQSPPSILLLRLRVLQVLVGASSWSRRLWRQRPACPAHGLPCYDTALAVKGYSSTPGITPHAVGLILSNLVRAGCVRVGRSHYDRWATPTPVAAVALLRCGLRAGHVLLRCVLLIALRAGHHVRTGSGQAAEEYGIVGARRQAMVLQALKKRFGRHA